MRNSRFRGAACLAALPLFASAAASASTCDDLATRIVNGRSILSANSRIVPAAGQTPAYCQVDLLQAPTINIRVGLPLSAADGGSGRVQGAWNGKVQNLGTGGFGGNVGSVTGPVQTGWVGSITDTGHNNAWCNAINPATGLPNSQPNCGSNGGGFVLDPQNNLIDWQVRTYMKDSVLWQTQWALKLSILYYGRQAARNYWVGCSGGGRQGFELALNHPEMFDGFVNGAPAIDFNRFIMGQAWVPTVVRTVLGPAGLPPAKSAAATAAAIAACDADDGVVDGLIDEPRRCRFDANALLCTGSPKDPSTCLTAAEAQAINMIWEGPKDANGQRLWGALPRGTSFNTLLPGGTQTPAIVGTWIQNWVHQNPGYDLGQITTATYPAEMETSYRKFDPAYMTDSTAFEKLIARGAKIIHYHSANDPLTLAFASYNFNTRLFDKYGVTGTQDFMRSFYYPGVGHCTGGAAPQPNNADLLTTLENWVETGVAPSHVVAAQSLGGGATRTRKICKYPDRAVYSGSGSTDDAANFSCAVNNTEPADLAASSRTNHD